MGTDCLTLRTIIMEGMHASDLSATKTCRMKMETYHLRMWIPKLERQPHSLNIRRCITMKVNVYFVCH